MKTISFLTALILGRISKIQWAFALLNFFSTALLSGQYMPYKVVERIMRGPPNWALERIEEDLSSVLPEDVTQEALDAAMAERAYGELLLVRYIIVDGYLHIHSTTPGVHQTMRYELFTKYLNEVVTVCRENCKIPDCDFIVSLHDAFSHAELLQTAVFSFAKDRNDQKVILVPDTEVLSSAENLHVQTNNGNAIFPWEQKVEKAVWRGTTTGAIFTLENYHEYPRFQLIEMSLKYPEWVDARFTDICQGVQSFQEHISQYMGSKMGVADHIRYKYQILVDGNSCAYTRAYWQLFSNSVIIKQKSDNIQWYYGALKPYIHYIPAASDFSDLICTLRWAKINDKVAIEICQNARNFAHANLLREDMYHYIYLVLCRYSALQQRI